MRKFLEGFREYRHAYHKGEDPLFASLKKGQNPRTMVVSCCDSRVDAALMLGCRPGDIFCVRNIAGIVPAFDQAAPGDSTVAALIYGVLELNVEDLVVLGHSRCGGIAALVHGGHGELPEQLAAWIGNAAPALAAARERFPEASQKELPAICERLSVLRSLDSLLSYPWIKERVEAGRLNLHGWYYDLEEGNLYAYKSEECDFALLGHQDPALYRGLDAQALVDGEILAAHKAR